MKLRAIIQRVRDRLMRDAEMTIPTVVFVVILAFGVSSYVHLRREIEREIVQSSERTRESIINLIDQRIDAKLREAGR